MSAERRRVSRRPRQLRRPLPPCLAPQCVALHSALRCVPPPARWGPWGSRRRRRQPPRPREAPPPRGWQPPRRCVRRGEELRRTRSGLLCKDRITPPAPAADTSHSRAARASAAHGRGDVRPDRPRRRAYTWVRTAARGAHGALAQRLRSAPRGQACDCQAPAR
eukprot:298920-Chlamydomonas_euryale.AAC.4